MPKASLRYLREQWYALARRCPRMAAFVIKAAKFAQDGFLRDSEFFEFNVRFSGRMPRSVFWCTMGGLLLVFVLVKLFLALALLLLGGLLYIGSPFFLSVSWASNALNFLYMSCVFIGDSFLFLSKIWLLLAALSATVRRVRDAGFSARYLPLAPFICFLKSKPATNVCDPTPSGTNREVAPVPSAPSLEPVPTHPQPPPKLCPLCRGTGMTATGFTCPQCGGSGKA